MKQKEFRKKMNKEKALALEVEKFANAESSTTRKISLGNLIFNKDKKQDNMPEAKKQKLEAQAALAADFKRLNMDERLSVMFSYCLVAKAIEIRTKREE